MPLHSLLQPVNPHFEPFYEPPLQAGYGFEGISSILSNRSFPFGLQDDGHRNEFGWRADYEEMENFGATRVRGNKPCVLLPHPVHQALIVVFPLAGKFEAVTKGSSIIASPGQALLLSTAEVRQVTAHPDGVHAHVGIYFPKAVVSRVYHSRFRGHDIDDVRLSSIIDLRNPAGNSLYRLTKTIMADLFGKQYFKQSTQANQLAAEFALHIIFDGHATHMASGPDGEAPAYVSKALRFIHANLHQPLTISTIAEAAGVSSRALQLGFRLVHGKTPMAYLRKTRLAMVHAELSKADNILSVGEVASKWGFTHMSQFSAQYRAEFAVNPSDTSRKAR